MLAKLEGAGLLTRGKEDVDPRAVGCPPRMQYTITSAAESAACLKPTALSDYYRPPVPGRRRLQGGTA
jgi:hypothetical protein